MTEDKSRIRQMERLIREKNIIVKGPFGRDNIQEVIRKLFTETLKIATKMEIVEIIPIGSRDSEYGMALIQFVRKSSVQKVFANINQQTENEADRKIGIQVYGDEMKIQNRKFGWRNNGLFFEGEPGYMKSLNLNLMLVLFLI